MARLSILLSLLLGGCMTAPSVSRSLVGQWGGQHVGLEVLPGGGRVDYDCAAGSIDEPMVADANGRFRVRGTHTPGHGGPKRVGEVPASFPALYQGSVSGDRMTLTVDVPTRSLRIGPFTLRRGAQPMLLRCL